MPYRSAAGASVPDPKQSAVGGVPLPPGQHVIAIEADEPGACAWMSTSPVDGLPDVMLQLATRFNETGLWPLVLESMANDDERPWLAGELDGPAPDTKLSAEVVLREQWSAVVPVEEEDEEAFEALAPFGKEFPGLAASPSARGDEDVFPAVVAMLEGRLGLVPVARPADAVLALGWLGPVNHFSDMNALSAVLRSWEDRFDAVLVAIGFDTITLAVGRPPKSREEALAVAAEHFAICCDNVYQGVGSIDAYADELLDAGRWDFWWD